MNQNNNMTLTRQKVIDSILSAWHQEIGGDEIFKDAYHALWGNGPRKEWKSEEFFEEFQGMKMMLPKLHPKDLAVLYHTSCNDGTTLTDFDKETGDYTYTKVEINETP